MDDTTLETTIAATSQAVPIAVETTPRSRVRWLPVVVAFASMLLFGFVENVKGTLIPPIRETFQVSYASIGMMLFIGSSGYLSATFLGGIAGDRFGQKRVLAAGYGLILVAGLGMSAAHSFALVCVLMFLLNAGFGSLEVGVNALGARIFVRNAALMMNLTHFFYGVGSMAGPEYAARMLLADRPWGEVYAFATALVVVVFAILALTKLPGMTKQQAEQRLSMRHIAADGKVWLFVAALSLFVVVELGTGNWLISFLRGAYGMGADESARFLSLFFVFFTLGRLVGGYVAERVGYVRCLALFAVAILCLYAGGFALGRDGVLLFSVTGFFISVMYPTFMAMIMKEFTSGTGSVMGFIITAVAAVTMLFNWVVGQTSDLLGVAAGFASFMPYTALAGVLLLLLNRRLRFNKRV
ncbi:MAG: MFS transporter [Chloroflexi bacterium]|nr:MFS transporter [Chloroflexota bacterium]